MGEMEVGGDPRGPVAWGGDGRGSLGDWTRWNRKAPSWMQGLGEGQCPTLAIMGLTVE